MSHRLAQAVCADERVRAVLHSLCEELCPLLEVRQFGMLEEAHGSTESVPFGHRVEVRRMVADTIDVDTGGTRQLQLRLAYNFYSAGPLAGRSVLNAELRDSAFLRGRTGSPQGCAAFATVLNLPTLGPVSDESTDVEPHVARLLDAAQQLDRAWLVSTAQTVCTGLCASLAP